MSDVEQWLEELGLGEYADTFDENKVEFDVLLELSDADLRELGIPLGHRKRLLRAIAALSSLPQEHAAGLAAPRDGVPAQPGFTSDAERRQLTVMFCDLVGSTALSTQLDPEDLRDIIRAFQNSCVEVIQRFDGLVARYMGDGVLAYFGYPKAHEDDAERAVRAGLGLIEAASRLKLPNALELRTRVGVATGLVVVGELIGSGEAQEREVLGETPNLAARLQSLAEPDSLVIADSTRHLLGELFGYADLGRHQLKGFDAPMRAWRVTAEAAIESRFEARGTTGIGPIVGREQELELLRDRWDLARKSDGQTVLLAGEPGIGKSRIIRGLSELLGEQPHTRLRYQCSPYHATSPLHPFITQLERAAGFEQGDSNDTKLDKLELLISRAKDAEADSVTESASLLAALLSIPVGERYPPHNLTPQRQKARTFQVLLAQFAGLAARQPVLVVFEDAHWIDATSEELLGQSISRLQSLPVLMVISFRPDYTPPWSRYPQVTSLALNRLSRQAGLAIADRLTGGKALPQQVLDQIATKTDGIPLFVEELTKTILESGVLTDRGDRYTLSGPLPELAIPATLQDSLIARLDRLAPVKQLAQIGAAVGREFSYEMIAALSPVPDDALRAALEQLVDAELLFCYGTPPQATYTFRHALMQDAAYTSMLRTTRAALHAQIAGTLEEHFPATGQTNPEILAHHFTQAGLSEQAIDWWHKAGQLAANRSANVEASEHFTSGLKLLAAMPETPARAQRELDMQLALGQAFTATKGFAAPEVKEAYTRARELCQQGGDAHQISRVLVGLWNFYMVRGELQTARELAEQRLALANESGDLRVQSGSHQNVGAILYQFGEFAPALAHLEEGMALYERLQHDARAIGSFNVRVGSLCYAAYAQWMLGYPDQALDKALEMLQLADEQSHPFSQAFALFVVARLHQFRREAAPAQERAEQLIAISMEQEFSYRLAQGNILRGWALVKQNAAEEGIARMHEGLDAWRATGAEGMGPYYLALLAEAYGSVGQVEQALDAIADAKAMAEKNSERNYQAELYRFEGELLVVQAGSDAEAQAEEQFRRAFEIARQQSARSLQLRAAVSLAKLLRRQGESDEARGLVAEVFDGFSEGFDTADLNEAKALMTELA